MIADTLNHSALSVLSGQDHVLVVEDERGRQEILLEAPIYSIGRDTICDIRLRSQFVSRRHATLVQLTNDEGAPYYRIVDGNLKGKLSVNGLSINNRKLKASDLQHGDLIVFGPEVTAIYYAPSTAQTASPLRS